MRKTLLRSPALGLPVPAPNRSQCIRCLALRPGFQHNAECNPIFGDDIDRFGLSSAIGYEIDRATLTLGLTYTFGSGTSRSDGLPLDISRSHLLLMLGGTFRFQRG